MRSCGKAFPILDWVVVDPETCKVLPTGGVGELLMKSPLVMSHYHNKPDKTAEVLVELEGTLRGARVRKALADDGGARVVLGWAGV